MKRFQLFKLLPLVAIVFAGSCTDATTGPATASRTLAAPDGPSLARGNEPPPPVDATVVVCTSSGCVAVDGTYFANGGAPALAVAALTAAISPSAVGEGECAFPGPARLRFGHRQVLQTVDFAVSADAQIKCSHQIASGHGTIEVGGVVVLLDQVLFFDNQQTCATFCASFTAETDPEGGAEGLVFDREFYDAFCSEFGGDGVCTPPHGGC